MATTRTPTTARCGRSSARPASTLSCSPRASKTSTRPDSARSSWQIPRCAPPHPSRRHAHTLATSAPTFASCPHLGRRTTTDLRATPILQAFLILSTSPAMFADVPRLQSGEMATGRASKANCGRALARPWSRHCLGLVCLSPNPNRHPCPHPHP